MTNQKNRSKYQNRNLYRTEVYCKRLTKRPREILKLDYNRNLIYLLLAKIYHFHLMINLSVHNLFYNPVIHWSFGTIGLIDASFFHLNN